MTAPSTETPGTEQTPAAAAPDPAGKPAKPSLEDTLAALDEADRAFVLGEVSTARSEAKNLRDRLRAAEPKVAEYDRLAAASKTAEERAQEATTAAEQRAATAIQRVARAEVKAALAGVVDNPDAIVEDLDLSRFVDADGEVDENAVKALRDKYAGFSNPRAPRPDASQASGANGKTTTSPETEFASFMQGQLRR